MDVGDVSEVIRQVRVRLDELEQQAQVCPPWPWKACEDGDVVMAADDLPVADGFALSNGQLRATVAHIACWDPGRVLATVAVDRLVLRMYEQNPASELLEAVLAVAGKYDDVRREVPRAEG